MRLVSLAWILPLALSAGVVAAESPSPEDSLPTPIPTRQTLFSIPFQVDRAEPSVHAPTEVQLHVSTNRGASWQLCDRVKPDQGHFLFRAAADGEYWFVIRTLDRSGQLRPQQTGTPGLRVIVDTTLPELQLDAQQGEAGEITVQWQVTEAYPDLDSLKIQYRADPTRAWQTVAIDRQDLEASPDPKSGKQSWWPEFESKVVEIRAEVSDTAGNTAVSHAKVNLSRQELADSKPAAAPSRDVLNNPRGTSQPSQSPWRASTDTSSTVEPQERYAGAGSRSQAPTSTGIQRMGNSGTNVAAQSRYANEQNLRDTYAESYRQNANASGQYREQGVTPGPPANVAPSQTARTAADDVAPWRPDRAELAQANANRSPIGDSAGWPPTSSVAVGINPAIGNQYLERPQQAPDSSPPSLPESQRPRMFNSRVLELDYSVDSVGPSGVGRVELWGTRDGGRTWTSFGVDPDGRSPMVATVNGEGLYGFRVAIQNRVGLGGERPRSGDVPDAWIGVDLTQPSARLISAEQGTGHQAGQLIIRWEASDQMLSARPVSLAYSDTPGGPWLPIASELENTGQYVWSVDRRAPNRVYLRLEVRDEAGNVGTFQGAEIVELDLLRPTVRIRDVRPAVQAAQTPPRRYGFRK